MSGKAPGWQTTLLLHAACDERARARVPTPPNTSLRCCPAHARHITTRDCPEVRAQLIQARSAARIHRGGGTRGARMLNIVHMQTQVLVLYGAVTGALAMALYTIHQTLLDNAGV